MEEAVYPLERRQLTIMFCDLVGSTSISDEIDPEEYTELIRYYRSVCVEPIRHFGGTIARFLGDGLLVYFGFPVALEDAACRAVRTALEVVELFKRDSGRGIAVRIGIHTGVVVVGDSIGDGVVERMAVFGSVPNIAARLQNEAEPNTVVISHDTYELLKGSIECLDLGERAIRGVSKPMRIYRAMKALPLSANRTGAGPQVGELVDRRNELRLLRTAQAQAADGEGQALVLTGEPGIGKSRLLEAFRRELSTLPACRWLTARGSPYAKDSDFFAFEEMLRREFVPANGVARSEAKFEQLEASLQSWSAPADDAIALGKLLSVEMPSSMQPNLDAEHLNDAIIQAILRWLEYESTRNTVILLVEDLHWVDASTYELIREILIRLRHLRILLLLTTRRYEKRLKDLGKIRRLKIDRLPRADSHLLLMHQRGASDVPVDARDAILKRANGNPLFIEELMKAVVPARQIGSQQDWQSRHDVEIPPTLRDALMARLDQTGSFKKVAQFAAVLGHRFTFELIDAAWPDDAQALRSGLANLIDSELLVMSGRIPDALFEFKHALVEETAYDSLLKSDRREYHEQVYKILSGRFAKEIAFRPEIAARHLAGAEMFDAAFEAWIDAGQASALRSANIEALSHLRNAEVELSKIEQGSKVKQHDRHLTLQLSLASVLIALVGWAAKEVEDAYRAALAACEAGSAPEHVYFDALRGLKNVYLLRGNLRQAYEIGKRLYGIAVESKSNELLLDSHRVLGVCGVLRPDFNDAERHLDSAILGYKNHDRPKNSIRSGIMPAANAYAWRAWAAWFSGHYRLSRSACDAALKHAEQHLFSQSYALCMAASLAHFDGDANRAVEYANEAYALAEQQSFHYWIAWAEIVRGWGMVKRDSDLGGLERIKGGIKAYGLNGDAQQQSQWLCMLADSYLQLGRPKKALEVVDKALLHIEQTGIAFVEPEFYRLRGEAMLALEPMNLEGRQMLARAIRCADRQRSPSLIVKSAVTMLPHLERPALQALLRRRIQKILTRFTSEPSSLPSATVVRALHVIQNPQDEEARLSQPSESGLDLIEGR